MNDKSQAEKPLNIEIAKAGDMSDITRNYIHKLMQPQDKVLVGTLGGNYEQYEELLRDWQVKSTFQQRRLAVTGAPIMIEPGADDALSKKAADALRENFEGLNIDRIVDRMLYGVFYGFSVGECMYGTDGAQVVIDDVRVRKQRRFRFGKGGADELYLLTRTNVTGELMPKRKFWVMSTGADNDDEPYGLGLAHHLYWPVFFKRSDIKMWMLFLDKLAMGTPLAKVPGGWLERGNPNLQVVKDALNAVQTDSGVAIPEGMTLELLEAARSSTQDYKTMESSMDAAIAKVVLSQVMTSEAVGGQYKADVQNDVRQEVVDADAKLLASSLREGPATWLTEWNYPGAAVPTIRFAVEPEEDQSQLAERDTKIYAMGYKPTQQYIDDKYGEGWEPREMGGANPFAKLDPQQQADFAEAAQALLHRQDQAAMAMGAKRLANDYEGVIGDRVEELLGYLDESNDFETFKKHMNGMLESLPKQQTVDRLENVGFAARLMGLLRGQRDGQPGIQ